MEGIHSYSTIFLMIGSLLGTGCGQPSQSTNSSSKHISEGNSQCPTWFIWNEASQRCECIAVNIKVIHCNNTSNRTSFQKYECVTYDSVTQTISIGWSPFANLLAVHGERRGSYVFLPENQLELNEFMCGGANREGLLCSKCKPGYGPSVSRYDNKCAKCSNTYSGWILYFSVTLIPTTVFFAIIVVCQIRTTAASMNLFVLVCQVTSVRLSPYQRGPNTHLSETVKIIYSIADTLLTSWNLDFFRLLIPPFCVSEDLSNMQVLCMEYIVAFYPLLLTVIMYVCIQLYARGCRLLVCAWKPFDHCFAPLVRRFDWNPATSIVHIFASFLLLSSTKILFVSMSLVQQGLLYNVTKMGMIHHGKRVLYVDPNQVLFGQNHLPYAVLAILVTTVFVVLPCLLLILYPFSFFQKCLNRCGATWHAVHAFADAFNGCYKNGTNGTRDWRSFAGFYLLLRIVLFINTSFYNHDHATRPPLVVMIVFLSVFLVVSPYKNRLCNILDSVALTALVCRYCLKGILYTILTLCLSVYFVLFLSCKIIFNFNCRCSQKLKVFADKLAGSRTSDTTHATEVPGDSEEENLPDRLVNPEGYRLLSNQDVFQNSNCNGSIPTYGIL